MTNLLEEMYNITSLEFTEEEKEELKSYIYDEPTDDEIMAMEEGEDE